ncbi:MAG: hypothetical protein Q8O67_31995 [Deltaproteobacteria bacterium]|nr:hypothetical protein [Deltaproteobacteria bacterium]
MPVLILAAVVVVVALQAGCFAGFSGDLGEGDFAEPVVLGFSRLVIADGVISEAPFDIDPGLGHPLAAGTLGDDVVVLAAEIVDEAYSGALLVHRNPFAVDVVTTRFDELWEPEGFELGIEATFGDLDDDGDDDLVVRSSHDRVAVIVDEDGALVALGSTQRLVGHGQPHALFDVDGDGDNEAAMAGLNGDSHVVDTNDGAVVVDTVNARPFVGALGYCARAYVVVADELFVRGEVCAGDGSVPSPPTGPDRVFVVADGALAVSSTSADSGLEAGQQAFAFDERLVVSGTAFLQSLDRSGDPRSVVIGPSANTLAVTPLANLSVVGAADLDGDGVAALVFLSTRDIEPPADSIVVDTDPVLARVSSVVVVKGGVGAGDIVLISRSF